MSTDTPLRSLLFVDVETGGLDANAHSLLQVSIGAFLSELGTRGPRTQEAFYVREPVITVDPQALEYNNVDMARVVAKGVAPIDGCIRVNKFLRRYMSKPVHLVAWNYALDRAFMQRLYRLASADSVFTESFSHRCLDLQSVVRFNALRKGQYALGFEEACQAYGVPPLPPHDAGNDVFMMMDLFAAMVRDA